MAVNTNKLKRSLQLSLDQERWKLPQAETCYFLAKLSLPFS